MQESSAPRKSLSARILAARVPDAALIAAVPIAASALVYQYYSGYFSVFNLPRELIDLEFRQILIVSSVLIGASFTAYVLGDLLISIGGMFPPPVRPRIRRLAITLIAYLAFMGAIGSPTLIANPAVLIGFGALLILAVEFVLPLFTQRGKGPYLTKLEVDEAEREKRRADTGTSDTWQTPMDRLFLFLGPEILLLVLIFFAAFGLGRFNAIGQKRFYVTTAPEEAVVLYISPYRVITSHFDRHSRTTTGEFTIVNLGDGTSLFLSLQEIGPLSAPSGPSSSVTPPLPTPSTIPTTTPTTVPLSNTVFPTRVTPQATRPVTNQPTLAPTPTR